MTTVSWAEAEAVAMHALRVLNLQHYQEYSAEATTYERQLDAVNILLHRVAWFDGSQLKLEALLSDDGPAALLRVIANALDRMGGLM